MLVVSGLASADLVAFGLLQQNVKIDLRLSDTQLGTLTGMVGAIATAILSVPMARWADRGNRVVLIACSAAGLSAMMALYSFATNYPQVLLIRAGVAAFGAGIGPASISLIAEYFNRAERPRAYARYSLGGPVATLVGYVAAGWLSQIYGWRAAFLSLSLPGFLVASLVWLSLREPRDVEPRTQRSGVPQEPQCAGEIDSGGNSKPKLRQVMQNLVRNATFRHLMAFWVLMTLFSSGTSQFQPAFLIRSYGLSTGELGTWYALISGLGGLIGAFLGGEWASRYAKSNEPRQLKVGAAIWSVYAVSAALFYLSTNMYIALASMGLMVIIASACVGPVYAIIQMLVPAQERATAIAIILTMSMLIGMGIGPLTVGALSDTLRPSLGVESLRYSSVMFCPGFLWVAWHLWRAKTTVARDLELMDQSNDSALAVNLDSRRPANSAI